MADNTHKACQITRVESHCVNYWVALQVTCSWLRETLVMDFFSLQTAQFMVVLLSMSHAVIGSTCTQLPFVWSAITLVLKQCCSPRVDGTFMASWSTLFEMELYFIYCCRFVDKFTCTRWVFWFWKELFSDHAPICDSYKSQLVYVVW